MKAAEFHPAALTEIKSYPKEIKAKLGELILDLQLGESVSMPNSRPMPSVAPGVSELRVKDSQNQYRAFYYLKVAGRVLVFHSFVKKTEKTLKREIDIGKKRLKELLEATNG